MTAKPDAAAIKSSASSLVKALAPIILGLVFARAGLIVATYGAYRHTDENIFTDGPMLASLVVLALCIIAFASRKTFLSEIVVKRLAYISIAVEALSIAALGVIDALDYNNLAVRFSFSTLCSLSSSLAIFYWLRQACGSQSVAAAFFCFSALIVSELELLICTFFSPEVSYFIAAALVIAQYGCMFAAAKRPAPSTLQSIHHSTDEEENPEEDFFSFGKMAVSSNWLLTAIAIGIGALSIVIGFLRGYPNGESIMFTPASRLAYCVLTIVISALIIERMLRGHRRTLTVGIFVSMELLACLALMLYAAFPDNLQYGAICTTTLNALMVGFTWYAVIAFMTNGRFDPYYYACACWVVWLGFRALARIGTIVVDIYSGNLLFTIALMGTLVVLSTQVVFLQFLSTANKAAEMRRMNVEEAAQREKEERDRLITRIMGLNTQQANGSINLSDMREEAMRHSAQEMGCQFMLSEREAEVLALYALGYTQKRVAEKLYISQGTTHAHIKNIYAKTNMHSRQELIDSLRQYS